MEPSPPGIRWPEKPDMAKQTLSSYLSNAVELEYYRAEAEAWRQAAGMLRERLQAIHDACMANHSSELEELAETASATLLATAPPTNQQDINPAHIQSYDAPTP